MCIRDRSLTAAEQRDFDGLLEKAKALDGTLTRAAQLGELRAEIERPVQPLGAGLIPASENGMIYGGSRNTRPGEVRIYKMCIRDRSRAVWFGSVDTAGLAAVSVAA